MSRRAMLMGAMLRELQDDAGAAAALEALGDIVLLGEIAATADRHAETPAEYVLGSVRRFCTLASHDDWFALTSALGRSADPARDCLANILRWSISRDTMD